MLMWPPLCALRVHVNDSTLNHNNIIVQQLSYKGPSSIDAIQSSSNKLKRLQTTRGKFTKTLRNDCFALKNTKLHHTAYNNLKKKFLS